jgi:DeoR/GlpR family transcriptional regulator of sugar metabolism
MLAGHRQSLILGHPPLCRQCRVSDTSPGLGVSDMTIRRDLEVLTGPAGGKVHDGAVPRGARHGHELGFSQVSLEQ